MSNIWKEELGIVFLPAEAPDLGVLLESESVLGMSLEAWDNLPFLKSV